MFLSRSWLRGGLEVGLGDPRWLASAGCGCLGNRWVGAWHFGVSVWAMYMTEVRQFYIMAIIVGCVQGGAQGLSRSLYASIIPPDQPGEFFGFYNMVTNLARVLGPLLVGIAATVSDDPKWVLLALMPLFVGGGMLLSVVREKQAKSATVS